MVADSPVDPLGTKPLEPCAICHSTKRWNAASSIWPFVKGVMRAGMDPKNMHNLRGAFAHMAANLVGSVRPGKASLCITVVATCVFFAMPAGAFTTGETSAARTALADADRGRWDDAYQVADHASFPLLTKLVTWLDYTNQGTAADFAHVSAFILANPDWPSQNTLRKRAEDVIGDADSA